MHRYYYREEEISRELARVIEPFLAENQAFMQVKLLAERQGKSQRRLGFLKIRGTVPAFFDELGAGEIQEMFAGKYV